MKNQRKITTPKEYSKLLVTDLKEVEIQDLFDIEFKTIIIRAQRTVRKHR